MGHRARLAAWIVGLVVAAGGGFGRVPARGDGATPDEKAFLAALEQAKGHLAGGRAAEGLKVVATALEKHAQKDYARAKRADLEDLVRRLSFRAECPPPDPQLVVKGKLKKFASKSGEIDIRYDATAPTDFEKSDGSLVFPARFRGPYTISVKGPSYPTTVEASPSIRVGIQTDPKTGERRSYRVDFGIPPHDEGSKSVWLPSRIVQYVGDEKKYLFEKETSPAIPRKPYRCEVSVGATRLTATLNGAMLGGAAKPDGVFGYCAIDVLDGWSEIGVSGMIEPSWIQSQVDAIVERKRAEFDARFDAKALLPGWLFEAAPAPAGGADAGDADPAADVPAEFAIDFVKAVALVENDECERALAAADDLRTRGAPEALVLVLVARAKLGQGEATEALASIEQVLAADKGSLLAAITKAQILFALGREDDAVSALRAATASPRAGVSVFESAAMFALYAGRPEDARATTEAAARRGLHSKLLEKVGRAVVRALNGPDWPKSYEFKSANYHVISDMDVETCRAATEVLEESLVAYRVHVRSISTKPTKLYKVYLFSGEAGFKRYLDDSNLLGRRKIENAAGIYSPLLKQLLIWSLPRRSEMVVTIRHEGFHQYLDRLLPDPPVWFNEGMATYYEGMQRVRGELKTDQVRPEYMKALEGKTLIPLKDFLTIRSRTFYADENSDLTYAQAWLFCHMLQHGKPRHRELYKAFLTALETLSGVEAMAKVFDPASLALLDGELEAWRTELASPK